MTDKELDKSIKMIVIIVVVIALVGVIFIAASIWYSVHGPVPTRYKFIVDFKENVTFENATRAIEGVGLTVQSHEYVWKEINGTQIEISETTSEKTLPRGDEKIYVELLEQNENVLEVRVISAIT